MNRIIIFETSHIKDSFYRIRNTKQIKHINEHLKLKENDSLKVSIVNKGIAETVIVSISKEEIQFKITTLKSPAFNEVKLIIGLCRPPSIKKIIEHGTAMGVTSFEFCKFDLSEKSYLQSSIFKESSLNELRLLGLSQSAHSYKWPEIKIVASPHTQWTTWEKNPGFILSPHTTKKINQTVIHNSSNNYAIGPERGWSNQEVTKFKNIGFKEIKISNHILRVEIAVLSLLAQIELLQPQ